MVFLVFDIYIINKHIATQTSHLLLSYSLLHRELLCKYALDFLLILCLLRNVFYFWTMVLLSFKNVAIPEEYFKYYDWLVDYRKYYVSTPSTDISPKTTLRKFCKLNQLSHELKKTIYLFST